jgi:hypothetical protein
MWAASFLWMLIAGILSWLAFFDHQNLLHSSWEMTLQALSISLITLGAVNLLLWIIVHTSESSSP